MVGKALQLALREMQGHFGDRRVLGGMAVVAVLLGLAGPFGTFDGMGLGPRLAYWTAMVIATYGVGYATALLAARLFGLRFKRPWTRIVGLGLLVSVPVTLAVEAVSFFASGSLSQNPLAQWLQALLIGICVMTILEILDASSRRVVQVPVDAPVAEAPAPILDRVPLPARGALWALVVQDHYVEIVTERGKTLVLMRLGDAIREVGATKGVQIHRSHWVALPAVARVVKAEGKPAVELPDGRRLGISRGYVDAARQAGLLT